MPMTPAPMMQRRRGTKSMLSNSVEVMMLLPMWGLSCMNGRIFDCEPVAIKMFLAVYCSPPTSTVWASTKWASPLTRVMPGCESSVPMPETSWATTWFLRSRMGLKSMPFSDFGTSGLR